MSKGRAPLAFLTWTEAAGAGSDYSAAAYADFRDRYRDMARTLGFEGHIAWAEEMP